VRFVAVRLVALLVAGIGAVNFLTALRPHHDAARLVTPVDGHVAGRAQMFVLGLLLLTVARGLIHRRWAAWIGGVATLGSAMLIAIPQHRPFATLLCGGALIALVALRTAFVTRPDPVRMRLASHLSMVAIGIAVIGGVWDMMSNRHSPGGAGREVLTNLSTGSPDGWRATMLTLTLTFAIVAAVIVAFAPAGPPAPGSASDRDEVRELAAHPDADSLAPFATRADKAYVFSPDRRAAIGYRVLLGTALVGGDPVGATSSALEAMRAYLALCSQRGWRPAVLGSSIEMRAVWRELGLRGLHIGDEAILPMESFSLESRRMRNLRQAVNRTRNAGVTVSIGRLNAAQADRLAPVLADWLHGERERGFAMNLDSILTPRPDCLVATAYARTGEPVAFARFAVCADGSCYTLDVAPRGRDAPNGVAERMIVEIVEHARANGAREVSLNFAALRWVFDSPGVVPRVSATMLHALDRWIEVGPLNRFAGKFAPQWRSRSLLMASWFEIGWVAAAALRAELGPAHVPTPRPPAPTETSVDVPERARTE
jgi:lysyl-tRNA synthetase, class II